MDEELKQMAIDTYDFTEKEVESLSEKQQKIVATGPLRRAYKTIIEVVKAENCALKPKVGDRYVLIGGGVLIPEECTFPLCLWALAPILPISYVIFERLSQSLDPNGHLFDHMKCTDTGVSCCGIGEVLFKVYCVKA